MNVIQNALLDLVEFIKKPSVDYFDRHSTTQDEKYTILFEKFISSSTVRFFRVTDSEHKNLSQLTIFIRNEQDSNELLYGIIKDGTPFCTLRFSDTAESKPTDEIKVREVEVNNNKAREMGTYIISSASEEEMFQYSTITDFNPNVALQLQDIYDTIRKTTPFNNMAITGKIEALLELWSTNV